MMNAFCDLMQPDFGEEIALLGSERLIKERVDEMFKVS